MARDKIPAQRLAAILDFNRQRQQASADNATLRARIAELTSQISDKETALTAAQTALAAAQSAASEAASKWEALKNATYWAELDSGKSIAVGTKVRYFGKSYTCVKAHTKSLIRLPTNTEYWSADTEE